MKRFLIVALVAALPILAACSGSTASSAAAPTSAASSGSSASSGGAAQQVTIKGLDTMKFEPATFTVKAGQPVQVTFQNAGQIVHDFVLTEGVSQPVKIEVQGGKTGTATFTIDKPGTYTFICSQPGHEAAGMKGTIVVQ